MREGYYLNYGRHIVVGWVGGYLKSVDSRQRVKVLDIGCGDGSDLINICTAVGAERLEPYGADFDRLRIEQAKQRGIEVFQIDVERASIPVQDGFFDIVIANQVIEHTKEIFWIFSEVARTLKTGGLLIVGVPNLASLHNRILLLLGEQPSAIDVLGPHIRGFTAPSFKRFIEEGDYFRIIERRGSNFYPFPPAISKGLSRVFPTLAVALFFLARREATQGTFIEALTSRRFETAYFKGDHSH